MQDVCFKRTTSLGVKRLVFFLAIFFMTFVIYYDTRVTTLAMKKKKIQKNTAKDSEDFSDYPVVTHQFTNPLLVYNRASKCGSTTIMWIYKQLASRHHFSFHPAPGPMYFNETEKKAFAKDLSKLHKNVVYARQFHFFDLSKYDEVNPVYINVVRDPVDRFISRYYFNRFGFAKRKRSVHLRSNKRNMSMTLEECVLGGVQKCIKQENHKPIYTFFCNDCTSEYWNLTRSSLNLAMKNAAQHYAAIGLTEDLDTTLKVFEALFPRYFQGAPHLLPLCPETSGSKSKNRTEPSKDVKSVLREALHIEIEFYEFVKERFYRQVDELKKLRRLA